MAARPLTLPRRSGALLVNPEYRDFLEQRGLTTPADFLELTGVIVSGHPDRHVLRVTLGSGDQMLTGFLKREHRVPWRARLANAWAGFGFVSQSCREAQLLRQLRRAGVLAPEWLAAGELTGAVELRQFLNGRIDPRRRRRLARKLGETLAHLHDAGFDHPDLYAKHILVNPRDLSLPILDWQRSRRRGEVGWPRRARDLAALHASLADDLATPRERLACLRAYLQATIPGRTHRPFQRHFRDLIRRQARQLLRHRHVGEQRQSPLAGGQQRLIWLDGEALCVTPELNAALGRQPPQWLTLAGPAGGHDRWRPTTVTLPGEFQARLVRRRVRWPLRWWWDWLRGKHLMSRELRQAGLLFRLQRYGVGTPRLLAFGQKHYPPRRTESFLLTEPPPGTVPFADWLAAHSGPGLWTAQLKQRRRLIRETAGVLRQMHTARCYLASAPAGAPCPFQVQPRRPGVPAVLLGSVEEIVTRRRAGPRQAADDLARLLRSLPRHCYSRTDALRFLLAYLSEACFSPTARRFARAILGQHNGSILARFYRWLSGPPRLTRGGAVS